MLKVLLQTLLGLILVFAGLFLTFNYIQNIVDGAALWLLLVSIPMIASGALLLLKAGKSDAMVLKKVKVRPLGAVDEKNKGLENQIEKNNNMSKDFGKTNDARNRLKLLEAAGNAAQNNS